MRVLERDLFKELSQGDLWFECVGRDGSVVCYEPFCDFSRLAVDERGPVCPVALFVCFVVESQCLCFSVASPDDTFVRQRSGGI